MNQFIFISDKSDVAAAHSDLQHFEQASKILTERFGFKVRNDRHGVFDFFYHADFKENIMEYGGGELRVKNPTDAFIDFMVKIAAAFPQAKVIDSGGARYLSSQEIRYPAMTLADKTEVAITEETISRTWSWFKTGMISFMLLCLAAVLNTFVF